MGKPLFLIVALGLGGLSSNAHAQEAAKPCEYVLSAHQADYEQRVTELWQVLVNHGRNLTLEELHAEIAMLAREGYRIEFRAPKPSRFRRLP